MEAKLNLKVKVSLYGATDYQLYIDNFNIFNDNSNQSLLEIILKNVDVIYH